MLSRLFILFLGLVLMFPPIVSFVIGKPTTLWGQPVHPIGEILCFVFGILLVYISLFKWTLTVKKKYICPVCEEVSERTGSNKIVCSACSEPMEELNGFYERHPEKKD